MTKSVLEGVRCLVVYPGSLAEQWKAELYRRFQVPFEILTNDKLEAARTGNWILVTPLVIARLDKLSCNEDVQENLKDTTFHWYRFLVFRSFAAHLRLDDKL